MTPPPAGGAGVGLPKKNVPRFCPFTSTVAPRPDTWVMVIWSSPVVPPTTRFIPWTATGTTSIAFVVAAPVAAFWSVAVTDIV